MVGSTNVLSALFSAHLRHTCRMSFVRVCFRCDGDNILCCQEISKHVLPSPKQLMTQIFHKNCKCLDSLINCKITNTLIKSSLLFCVFMQTNSAAFWPYFVDNLKTLFNCIRYPAVTTTADTAVNYEWKKM